MNSFIRFFNLLLLFISEQYSYFVKNVDFKTSLIILAAAAVVVILIDYCSFRSTKTQIFAISENVLIYFLLVISLDLLVVFSLGAVFQNTIPKIVFGLDFIYTAIIGINIKEIILSVIRCFILNEREIKRELLIIAMLNTIYLALNISLIYSGVVSILFLIIMSKGHKINFFVKNLIVKRYVHLYYEDEYLTAMKSVEVSDK